VKKKFETHLIWSGAYYKKK